MGSFVLLGDDATLVRFNAGLGVNLDSFPKVFDDFFTSSEVLLSC